MISVLVPFPDGAQAEVQYSLGGLGVSNRLWFQNRQPPTTGTQVQALADALFLWWAANVMPPLSFQLALLSVLVKSWDDPNSPLIGLASGSVAGGSLERSHSANVAIRVPFGWPLQYNLRQNSNFVPGVPLDQVDVNNFSSSIRHDLFEAYAGLIDAAVLFGPFPAWRWVAVSLQESRAPRAVAFSAEIIGPKFVTTVVSPRRYRTR